MTPLKLFPAEAPNDTNVDEVIKKASENDAGKSSITKEPLHIIDRKLSLISPLVGLLSLIIYVSTFTYTVLVFYNKHWKKEND